MGKIMNRGEEKAQDLVIGEVQYSVGTMKKEADRRWRRVM